MSHALLLIFIMLSFSYVLDLKEKSQETHGTSFLILYQGTIVILSAYPVLELSRKKSTAGPNHAVILC